LFGAQSKRKREKAAMNRRTPKSPGALALAGALGGLLLMSGCGGAPRPADAEAAPKALQSTLDAWKAGQSREAFSKESRIQTSDSRWDGGYKLLGYEVGPGEPHGYDLNFKVTLRLEDAKGKKLQEKATYAVSTSPRTAVIRLEEM
jgi:hypothetical protein